MRRDPVSATIQKHQIMRGAELIKIAGSYLHLRRKVDDGLLISLGSGLYATPSLDPFVASVLAVAKYYPNAVISGETALLIHGLGESLSTQIDADIPRNQSIRNKLLRIHRVPETRIIGVVKMRYFGKKIKIYDPERSLCDAHRKVPGASFYKALKRYMAAGKINAEKIAQYDKKLKTHVLMHLQQEQADG